MASWTMDKLLGNNSVVAKQYKDCKAQIENLMKRIKQSVDQKDDEVLSKFASQIDEKKSDVSSITPVNAGFNLQQTLKGHSDKIYALQWSLLSTNLVSASQDGSLVIWTINGTKNTKQLGIPLRMSWVMTVAYSPNAKYVASGGLDNLCSIYNIQDKYGWSNSTPHRELQQHEGYISCCKFIDDNHILTSSGDSTCIYWDIEYQAVKSVFIGHTGDVDSVAYNTKTKNTFISGSIDTTAKIWDVRQQKCVNTFSGHVSDVNCVKWFPDFHSFGTASDDGCCRLFDVRSYQTLNIYGHKMTDAHAVTSLDFSKSGYYLVASYDEDPHCLSWNTVTAKEEKILEHPSRVSSLEFSPNGFGLCTGCWDKNLRIWA